MFGPTILHITSGIALYHTESAQFRFVDPGAKGALLPAETCRNILRNKGVLPRAVDGWLRATPATSVWARVMRNLAMDGVRHGSSEDESFWNNAACGLESSNYIKNL